MKRAFLGVLTSVILLSAGTATAFAADYRDGHYFIDADGDGICDNCGVYRQCAADEDCWGRYFVDGDGDGICDNCGSHHWCATDGTECGRYFADGNGDGCGRYFVDANGDGICDNYADNGTCGHGQGYRRGHGGHCVHGR